MQPAKQNEHTTKRQLPTVSAHTSQPYPQADRYPLELQHGNHIKLAQVRLGQSEYTK